MTYRLRPTDRRFTQKAKIKGDSKVSKEVDTGGVEDEVRHNILGKLSKTIIG